jgi:hypothetical protein
MKRCGNAANFHCGGKEMNTPPPGRGGLKRVVGSEM